MATAGLSPADISVPIRSFFRKDKNVEVVLGEVEELKATKKQAILKSGKVLPYDKLVIAAGAKNYIFNESWNPHVRGLKSVSDALEMRKSILLAFESAEIESDPEKKKAMMTFVVIGAGPTGVELAGSIAELARFSLVQDFRNIDSTDARIILIEAGPRVLAAFHPSLSQKAKKDLERLGVSVWLKSKVTKIERNRVELGDDAISSHNIIWAAGVTSVDLANEAKEKYHVDLKKADRLPVNKRLEVVGAEDMYALGDIAFYNENPLPGTASVAIQQGKYLGKALRRLAEGKEVQDFIYKDKGQMATIGRSRAIAEIGNLRLSGLLAWYMWVFVHIYFLIGFRNRVSVFLQWFWSYATYKKGARIIN